MKKSLLFAAVAMVAFAACNKEMDAPVQDGQQGLDAGDVTIMAYAPEDDMTKTMVDGVSVKWAAGDHIAVFDDSNVAHDFELTSGEGTTAGKFSGTIGTSSGFAVYPFSANAAFDGSAEFTLDYLATYTYSAVPVPLIGMEDSGNPGKYDFDNVGGAFKFTYTNVPAGADKFVFTATTNVTGTGTYNLSDFTFTANTGKVVTVTELPSASTLTIIVPVPAGSYSFDIKLLDSSDEVITGSGKTVSAAKTVVAGHMLPMKAIKIANRGDVLWSEDFSSYSSGNVPGTGDGEGWAGATIDYSVTNGGGTTKIYEDILAGGTSPELLVAKTNGTFVATGVPTGNWTDFTLDYYSNKNISVEVSIASSTVGDAVDLGSGHYRRSITIPSAASTMNITFKNTYGSNARLDNIVLIAGAPVPGITVTTADATATSTGTGTTATLNGSLTLINGALNASVTEAGFYYKLSAAVDYTKVTCGSAPTSTTSFSYNLTGLTTGSEYTYYAYAIYNNGSEVKGEATKKTFTPTVGKSNQVLFHETFGNNTGSARAWNDSYSVKSGVTAVYSGITGYTITNAKQSKNTMGSTASGLTQTTNDVDAVIIIGPLAVSSAENMVLTYEWNAASTKGTYTTKLYYATSSGGTYTEVSGTGTGATSYVTRTYNLPAAAQVSTLYLKIVWNTSNTGGLIDEVNLQGDY